MRRLTYISPTRVNLFYKDPKEFYLTYVCPHRPPELPQTLPMSVGSSFDAWVKSYLYEKLFGKGSNPKYDLKELFEAQVHPHCRDFAWPAGQYAFEQYKKSGALLDLLTELSNSIGKPHFEIEITGVVDGFREGVTRDVKGVVFLGKPDVFYINKYGCHVILDFKVNGFCGNYNTAPLSGYVRLRKPNETKVESFHRNCTPIMHNGIIINCATHLENLNVDWANQLTIYGWLLGVSVGEDFVAAIDQLCCNGTKRVGEKQYPEIRVAEHRLRVRNEYQYELFAKCQEVWSIVNPTDGSDPWIFRNMSYEESLRQCRLLDNMSETLRSGSEEDRWLLNASRG